MMNRGRSHTVIPHDHNFSQLLAIVNCLSTAMSQPLLTATNDFNFAGLTTMNHRQRHQPLCLTIMSDYLAILQPLSTIPFINQPLLVKQSGYI